VKYKNQKAGAGVNRPYYIPETIFSIPLGILVEPHSDKIPRLYTKDFLLLRAKIEGAQFQYPEFCIIASAQRPDTKKALTLVEHMKELTDGKPCVVCSPELDFHQKEVFANSGVGFIQNDRNMFVPFLGISAHLVSKDAQPKKLSAQTQRIVSNVIMGTWLNLSAGDLAKRVGRSPASVSSYLSEIAAISPSLIEADGRSRILRNPGFSKDEILNNFEPYLGSPVKKQFKIVATSNHLERFAELGFLLASSSALEAKTDLAFNQNRITLMITEQTLKSAQNEQPELFGELPWWQESDREIQVWSYPIDYPDTNTRAAWGIASVDDLSLYLSLKDKLDDDDVRTQDALEQVRRKICR
jgi:hypothetical protein